MDQNGRLHAAPSHTVATMRFGTPNVPELPLRPCPELAEGEGKAIVAMTFEHIEGALGLPEGVRLTAVRVDVMRGVLEFRFDGLGLPPRAEGAEPMRFESLREAWECQSGGVSDVGRTPKTDVF